MKIYLMDLKQVCEAIGFRKTAIYGWMRKGTFPRPVKIGRNVRWSSSEIEAWINGHISHRDSGAD
ncbi:TPA: AlpA family phage regulatory protein [Klebsiella michiganensis]|nr:AlpA family transcriptional regulator [Klebsiella michiganensis]HAV2044604.1 AlpA family phage regulatory protein [Raoultella ornithinolytica]HBZ7708322.1 AlpA family phage regulatory protein [Klebsiella variicola subsp. variicola]HDG9805761.1 AlpA family phage regulatory protein [Raoultella planticola]HAV2054491.1 AlpA family phage regulatory protein [Raoultella ornithinolytica]